MIDKNMARIGAVSNSMHKDLIDGLINKERADEIVSFYKTVSSGVFKPLIEVKLKDGSKFEIDVATIIETYKEHGKYIWELK